MIIRYVKKNALSLDVLSITVPTTWQLVYGHG